MRTLILLTLLIGMLNACTQAPAVVDGAVVSPNADVEKTSELNTETASLVAANEADNALIDAQENDAQVREDLETKVDRIASEDPEHRKGEASETTPPNDLASSEDGIVLEELHFDHSIFNVLLKKYVTPLGVVNYGGFKGNPEFDRYLKALSANPPRADWPKNERMAYWINAYNAFTIQLINNHSPLKSIKDIGAPWKKKFILIAGENYDLNTIEHEILRKQFDDSRIHFAINCASASCPKLLNQTYEFHKLDFQLNKAAKDFVNDPFRNIVSAEEAKLSKIFDWFKADFKTDDKSLIDYINQYAHVKANSNAKISYLDYDWSLNDK